MVGRGRGVWPCHAAKTVLYSRRVPTPNIRRILSEGVPTEQSPNVHARFRMFHPAVGTASTTTPPLSVLWRFRAGSPQTMRRGGVVSKPVACGRSFRSSMGKAQATRGAEDV